MSISREVSQMETDNHSIKEKQYGRSKEQYRIQYNTNINTKYSHQIEI